MHKILILLFLIISIPILSQSVKPGDSPSGYVWKDVGPADFNGPDYYGMNFKMGPDGVPYVSYGVQVGYNTYLPAVEKFNGTQWIFVGSHPFGSGYYGCSSLAISPSGEPYLAFKECSPDCIISCMKFNGNDWVYLNSQGDLLGSDAESINMAFSPAGEPWVVFSEDSDSRKVSVKKFDGTQWSYVGPSGFSEQDVDWDCLAFSGSGEAYVAYRYGNNTMPPPVEVRKFDGTNWVTVGTPQIPEGVSSVSLEVDTSGQPWVAVGDGSLNFRLSVLRFNGSQWVYVGSQGITSIAINTAQIDFSPSGEPWVTYSGYNSDKWVSVIKFDGNKWVYIGDSVLSPDNSNPVNIGFRSDGEPYVGFYHIGCNVIRYDSLYTGIKPNKAQTMLLYPNPASSFLTINLNNQGILGDILKIFDMRGTQILEKSVSGNIINLDVSSFPVGIYCAEITGQESYFYGMFCTTQ